MKKYIALLAVAMVAGVTQAASLKEGTTELTVDGVYNNQDNDNAAISASYGQFIQDNVEVGVGGSYVGNNDTDVWSVFGFGEYNFDQGNEWVPYVGLDVGYVDSSTDSGGVNADANALEVGGHAGVKYFVAENIAISGEAEYDWASDDVYPDDNELSDTNFQLNLGMRFYIP